jgi:putative polyketide hydroxylase
VLVERHPDLLIHPRLRGVSPRVVEAYWQGGLEPAIQAASHATGQRGRRGCRVRAGTLASEHTLDEEGEEGEEGEAGPCWLAPIDQNRLEVLLRHQMRHPARVVILIDCAGFTDYFCGEAS